MRNVADIAHISPLMQPGKRLVIVGGGYIGLETATVARKIGLKVTVTRSSTPHFGSCCFGKNRQFLP
ncbi:MAG: NAD-binding protein [Alphaproteobacteria bacterium]|nr:NAD-binding protein [Alphaproteobacteria bacterium]